MNPFLLVFVGGGLGAVLRYAATLIAGRAFGNDFPWGTAMVNLAGCLLIGVLYGLAERGPWPGPSARLLLMTGFLGGLTTFSAFGLENAHAARMGSVHVLLSNIALNVLGGLALVSLGILAARLLK